MFSKSLVLAYSVISTICSPRVDALPTNPRTLTARSDRPNTNAAETAAIVVGVAVALALVIVGSCHIARRHSKQHRGLMNAQMHAIQLNSNRNPARRTTLNYVTIAERTGNSRVETWGSETRVDNASARQPRVNRRQSQSSIRSLPVYEQDAQEGEVVLVERVERRSMTDNDEENQGGHESEGPSPVVPPYSNAGERLEVPHVSLNKPGSRPIEIGTSSVESLQIQPENPPSNGTTPASSTNINVNDSGSEHPEQPGTTVSVDIIVEPTDSNYSPPHEDVPSYDEAVAITQTSDITEAGTSILRANREVTN